jgi:hypothetical protein
MLILASSLAMLSTAHGEEVDCTTIDYYGHFAFVGCGDPVADRMTQEIYGYIVDFGEVLVENDKTDLGVSVHVAAGLSVTSMAVWLGDPELAPEDTDAWTWTERDPCLGDGMRIPLDLVDSCTDVTVQVSLASYGASGEVLFAASASAVVPYCLDSCGVVPEPDFTECEPPEDGLYRTQTQGGWGTKAAGHNPGTYRDAHFDAAFPSGLEVGCDTHALTFTSSSAVEDYLPRGGKPSALAASADNPGKKVGGVLAGQTLALALSLGFDEWDASFGAADSALADLSLLDGAYAGWTVREVYDQANDVLGGCADASDASSLNEALSAINETFVDGSMDAGTLVCPL